MHKVRDDKLLKRFARNLKKARVAKGMTQEDLSDKSGLALSQIARIETGKLNMSIGTVYALLKALNVPANELFD